MLVDMNSLLNSRSRHVKELIYTDFSGIKLAKFFAWTNDFNKVIGAMRAGL